MVKKDLATLAAQFLSARIALAIAETLELVRRFTPLGASYMKGILCG